MFPVRIDNFLCERTSKPDHEYAHQRYALQTRGVGLRPAFQEPDWRQWEKGGLDKREPFR